MVHGRLGSRRGMVRLAGSAWRSRIAERRSEMAEAAEQETRQTTVEVRDVKWTTCIIVGAGPTGLMLAEELALAGAPCRILERRSEESNLTRAFGVHARTLEVLDMRGMADELVPQGLRVPAARPGFGKAQLDLSCLESRFPYVLIV